MLDGVPTLKQVRRLDESVRVAGEVLAGVRRIVLVRDDGMAGCVCSLPAVAAVRKTYPAAFIGMLVRRATEPLARLSPDIDRVLAPGLTVDRMEEAFKAFRPDLMVSLSRSSRAAWAAWRAGVPHRVGTGFRLYSPLFTRRVDERRRDGSRHEVEYALSFAHRVGAEPAPAAFRLSIPDQAGEGIGHWLALHRVREPYVVIHPGAGRQDASWPPVHFVRLAMLLVAEGIPVVFSMGEGDGPFLEALEEDHLMLRRLPRFQGDAASLAALLDRSAVVVGNGTGAVQLASALGRPVLAFHPPWPSCSYRRRGPYGAAGWALVVENRDAAGWSAAKRRTLGPKLMAAVTPADARRCVAAMLDGRKPTL